MDAESHKRRSDRDGEESSRKRHKKHSKAEKKKKKKAQSEDDEDLWIEKQVNEPEPPQASVSTIPTSKSLAITSSALEGSPMQRGEWMLPATAQLHERSPLQDTDFFSGLGTIHKTRDIKEKPDPDKIKISSRELNTQLAGYIAVPGQQKSSSPLKPVIAGGPGSQWRMMKLRRVYETARDEGRPVQDVALERYGNMDEFTEAERERTIIDERERETQHVSRGREIGHDGEKRLMFTEGSRPGSRHSFQKPGGSGPSTPAPSGPIDPSTSSQPTNRRLDSLRSGHLQTPPGTHQSKPSTPIPSVMTPQYPSRMSPSALNKLQAKALRAKLMDLPEAIQLEKEYENAKLRSEGIQGGTKVQLLPSLDGQGRLYDTGVGQEDGPLPPGNRQKKVKLETRDPKTGEIIRYNEDDDRTTLGEMLRQEKFSAGSADQKDMDAQLAGAIISDGKFEDDLDYMDDNAEKLGRKKMRTDAMKRQFAIQDYRKTQKALANCQHCYGEDDSLPKAAIIAMGTQCYLACTLKEELVEGHCHIVPIQHHLTTLDGDDNLWDEIRNFMKCLIRMFADQGKGVIFYETVINIRWQKHTYLECVPVPWDQFHDLPQYFKESILASESEWSQHKKVIDFSARPGGFRRAMVPNLPYFMVQFDYKGEKGFGHVIEGVSDAAGGGDGGEAVDEGEKGGGEFPPYFAAEIIGNVLDVSPRLWRNPRRVGYEHNQTRAKKFQKSYERYDWTSLLKEQ